MFSTAVPDPSIGQLYAAPKRLRPLLEILFDETDAQLLVDFLIRVVNSKREAKVSAAAAAAPGPPPPLVPSSTGNNAAVIGVQIADRYLPYSDEILAHLRRSLASSPSAADAAATSDDTRFLVLADNVISQCCPDEVTAQHYGVDGIVQIGSSCFSKPLTSIPVFISEPRPSYPLESLVERVAAEVSRDPLVENTILVVQCGGASRVASALKGRLAPSVSIFVAGADSLKVAAESGRGEQPQTVASAMRSWELGAGIRFPVASPGEPQKIVYVGPTDGPLLSELLFVGMSNEWNGGIAVSAGGVVSVDVGEDQQGAEGGRGAPSRLTAAACTQRMRQRMFNVEAVKNASVVGIVVSTAGMKESRELAELLRALCIRSGKRAYVIYSGCLNPAKLANFADSVDAFVVIACAASQVAHFTRKSDGYMKPLVAPMELVIALAEVDFADPDAFVTRGGRALLAARAALARLEQHDADAQHTPSQPGGSLVAARPLNVSVVQAGGQSALQRLRERSYVGLEMRKGETPVQGAIVEGRFGVALGYSSAGERLGS